MSVDEETLAVIRAIIAELLLEKITAADQPIQ